MNVLTPAEKAPDPVARIAATAPSNANLIASFAAYEGMPALVYGIISNGQLIDSGAAGLANLAAKTPVSPDTLFRIASMTKSFTAVAILQLRDAGQLALDQPVAHYIPALATLPPPTTDAQPLTVRHLLTMAAGWPEDNPWGDRQLELDDDALDRFLAGGITFATAPASHYEYSNLGYMILGRVVGRVAGMPYQAYVQQHILRPLGMSATCWNVEDVHGQSVAMGYREVAGALIEEPSAFAPSAGDGAAFGGLYSSVRDLARWVAFLLSAWPARDEAEGPVLRRSSLREMQRCANPRPPVLATRKVGALPQVEASGYAYGLFVADNSELGRIVGHAGGLPGYGSHMVWLPDRDLGVVTLANRTYAPAVPIALQLLRRVVTQAAIKPRRVHPAASLVAAQAQISRLIGKWDDALADELMAANFFLDEPRERWRARVADLHTRHGKLHPEGELEITNPLRGVWTMRGARGWCRVAITLAPTVPPRVQHLSITSIFPPDAKMLAALDALLAAVSAPTQRVVARLFDSTCDRRAALDDLRAVKVLYGACTLEQILGGDGVEHTVARLQSLQGALELDVVLNRRTGKFTFAEFRTLG